MRQKVPFILASSDHGTVIVSRLDWRKISDTHMEFGVGTDILVHGSFDLDLISITGGLLQVRRERYGDGAVALDCGANLGMYTLEWAKLMAGWGCIIAFEPQERIYYALAGNIAINNHFNARALHKAVGERNDVIEIPVPDYQLPGQYGGLNLENKANIGQDIKLTMPVEMVAIDALGLPRVDFIKIDIEGMEAAALNGARDTIKRNDPYLLIEWHIAGKAPIEAILSDLGYEQVYLGMNMIATPKGDPFLPRLQAMLDQYEAEKAA